MPLTRFAFLFRKYYQKTATPEEAAEFTRLAALEEHAAELQQLLEEAWAEPGNEPETGFVAEPAGAEPAGAEPIFMGPVGIEPVFTETESENMLRRVLRGGEEATEGRVIVMAAARSKFRWMRAAVAAVVLIGLGLGVWWWAHRPEQVRPQVAVASTGPKPVPGGNKAVLILANGSTVTLDSTKTGLVALQGNTNVVKVGGGQIAYQNGMSQSTVLYNTVRTPRGGQYQVMLPDGSRVWLNAATSLRFPTAFAGTDRTVELSGEAYFEVAPGRDRPFKVKVGAMTVDVLGTHFDVMAYDDEESFRTTLLSGAVRVSGGDGSKVLKPGEGAALGSDRRIVMVAEADTDQAVAWKNGLFQFESAEVKEVMRQVARWYDIDVHYEGRIDEHFSGFIARNAPLTDVLHQLQRAVKTSFTLEGRTVTVKPK